MSFSLSKSQFMRGIQCHKSLWLFKNRPDLRTPPEAFQQAIFNLGNEVGLSARGLFPGGKEIQYDNNTFQQKIDQTGRYTREGAETIYEATFLHDDIIVMVDILRWGDRGWELYEVKSSTSLREEYLNDVSIQYHVLSGSGLALSRVFLVNINNEYVRRGDIKAAELFNLHDLTDEVIRNQIFVSDKISHLRSILGKDCPAVDIGPQCSSPHDCDFIEHCWAHIPEKSVFDLTEKGVDKFGCYYSGIVRFTDLDLNDLNYKQRMQVEAELNDTITIDIKGIQEFLGKLHYPQCFMDFETFMPPIPLYEGTRPYQPIPFQYSIHCLKGERADLKHHEYLADVNEDPREKIAADLSTIIPEDACVITYNSAFEKSRLKDMAEQFPHLSKKLMNIHDRIIDLMPTFRKRHYYRKEMGGSYSMKAVLPALVPDLSYAGMAVCDGSDAMNIYTTLHLVQDEAEVRKIRRNLLEYCTLDTLGMVRIVEKLKEVCRKESITQ
jgi:hypothetical protein